MPIEIIKPNDQINVRMAVYRELMFKIIQMVDNDQKLIPDSYPYAGELNIRCMCAIFKAEELINSIKTIVGVAYSAPGERSESNP